MTKKTKDKKISKKEKVKNKVKERTIIIGLGCLIIAIVAVLLIFGTAASNKVNRTLQKQTPSEIKYDNKKINVYLFWGDGCPHCEQLIKYLDSLPEKYDEYFDLYTFEVWYNQKNNDLMTALVEKLGKEVTGIPCLIIGDQVFTGFDETMKEPIKKAIKDEYLKVDHYDVYREYK
mgnify:FL=1